MDLTARLDEIIDEIRPVMDRVDADAFRAILADLEDADAVFVAGAGRSGLIMEMLAMRLMQTGLRIHVVGEATAPAITANDLLLIASGSGRTATMRALAEKSDTICARLALITYTPASPLAQAAQTVLHLPVPPAPSSPGGLASTQPLGTLFDMCLVFCTSLLVEAWMQAGNVNHARMQRRHANLE